jgi:hypothetical protein
MTPPDFFERAQAEAAVQHFPGVPEFEAATILGVALIRNWLPKKDLAEITLSYLSKPATDMRLMLHNIDILEKLGFIHKHQFKYEITPTGHEYLDAWRKANDTALSVLHNKVYRSPTAYD